MKAVLLLCLLCAHAALGMNLRKEEQIAITIGNSLLPSFVPSTPKGPASMRNIPPMPNMLVPASQIPGNGQVPALNTNVMPQPQAPIYQIVKPDAPVRPPVIPAPPVLPAGVQPLVFSQTPKGPLSMQVPEIKISPSGITVTNPFNRPPFTNGQTQQIIEPASQVLTINGPNSPVQIAQNAQVKQIVYPPALPTMPVPGTPNVAPAPVAPAKQPGDLNSDMQSYVVPETTASLSNNNGYQQKNYYADEPAVAPSEADLNVPVQGATFSSEDKPEQKKK